MATAVGLWIGAATSTAAILREDASDTRAPEFIERDTVLYTTEDGTTTLGVVPDAPLARTATDFVDLVGNPDGIVLDDGVAYRAEDLLATGVFCLLENCPADVDPDTASLALAHPQDWTADTVTAVIGSLNYLGLRSVSLVPVDATAAPTGHTASHLAALGALAAESSAGGIPTEEFSAVPARETSAPERSRAPWTMVDAPAYSAVVDPPPTPIAPATTPAVVPAARPVRSRRGRAPILVAAGAAATFALVGGAIALAMGEYSETAVPPITNADAAPPTTTSTTTHPAPAEPIAFPTWPSDTAVPTTVEQHVAPPPIVEVAQVATTTAVPPPPVETTPPPPETTEAPTTTEPPATTTEPTTTEPTTTEPTNATESTATVATPTTTPEHATNGRVQSGTVFTGTLQPTPLDEMPSFDDSGDAGVPDHYPPVRPYRDDADQ